jgi:hypothetical protein
VCKLGMVTMSTYWASFKGLFADMTETKCSLCTGMVAVLLVYSRCLNMGLTLPRWL